MGYRYHIAHIDQRKKIETKKSRMPVFHVHVAVWRVVVEARGFRFAYSGTS